MSVPAPGKANERRVPFANAIDRFVRRVGHVICWANAALIAVIITQIVLDSFGAGKVALDELQWHLYAFAVMMGASYAQVTNSQIRVDVIASRLSPRAMRRWEIFGIVAFALPFVAVVFIHSLDFLAESWRLGERSDAPLGLPWRWVIKSVIPMSFALLGLALVSRLVRELADLFHKD